MGLFQKTLILLGAASISLASHAQSANGPSFHSSYDLPDWRGDLTDLRLNFQSYRSAVLNDNSLSVDEKVDLIIEKRNEIRSSFVEKRQKLYQGYRYKMGVPHSCTKGYSGGTKDCGKKCETVTRSSLYTKEKWVEAWRKDTDKRPADLAKSNDGRKSSEGLVTADGKRICTKELIKSGKGRKAAYTLATFRIEPASINQYVEKEADAFMTFIVSSPT